jgi:hypothetical protein
MKINHTMTTLSEAMNHFREEYNYDFDVEGRNIIIRDKNKIFKADELTILQSLRFEGQSDPADMSVLYLIEADSGEKGMFIDAYGTYADQDGINADELVKAMKISDNHSKE